MVEEGVVDEVDCVAGARAEVAEGGEGGCVAQRNLLHARDYKGSEDEAGRRVRYRCEISNILEILQVEVVKWKAGRG